MSLFLICEISWAITPFNSFSESKDNIPWVTATTALFGFGPVAKAFEIC